MNTPLLFAILLAIFILAVGGLTLIGFLSSLLAADSTVRERINTFAALPEIQTRAAPEIQRQRLVRLRLQVNNFLSVFASRQLQLDLISANWAITVSEYILIRWGVSLLGLAVGWVGFDSLLSGLGLAILGYILPGIVLKRSLQNRRARFAKQLVDVLVLINGAVKSGYSLLQSLDLVVNESPAPSSEEFRRVTREVGLGVSFSDALRNLSRRMENDDLDLLVTAITINTQVGGNMSVMLETVTETIRERMRLFGEIRVMTTHQRFTGYLLTMLPFIIGAVLFVINPQYMEGLFDIACIPIGALVGILLGNIIVRRLIRVDV